ncbi:C6 transcription factor, putative [Metarhizium acridum CQMa 102]|uniref:C6 transcription factor, putative n=1 Tax=Metarhizium acridum (strain CQMa 102) TaxID=655827 RepID=E9E6L7_METAQ|nr:C6 transcription factor, putative [Metarhizium acridum CQMa 102]EFY88463.1 C6 transcription factor, putative [Metarhizium acridum CQMa 102]
MSTAKATKKSAFSCEPCRRRKLLLCMLWTDSLMRSVSGDRNPTLSYTQRLEERIKELEDQVVNLTKSPPSLAGSSHSSPAVSGVQDVPSQTSRHATDEQGIGRSFRSLKIDDKGSITYHGATSFFNLPSDRTGPGPSDMPFLNPSSSDTDLQRRERLIHNAWHQRAMENLNEIPEPFQYLLNVHWCWIQPLFNFIYRPVFTRDMHSMGPYYSHTLLNAVISHSIRWGRSDPSTKRLLDDSYQGGLVFGKHARSMLFEELNNGVCTIPTIQTLLLLSAQECSQGNSTQAWTYSGIAFRLLDHLGICVDSQRFPGSVPLSDEELEIRRRIYWGCYFWDKLICLYLGRSPSLQHTNISPSHIMFDDSAENDLWVPFGIPQTDPTWKYPPTTAHSASCFMSMCRLAVIFNEILIHMYDPLSQNTDAEIQECLNSQEPLLHQWWDQLPVHLKINPISLPNLAPPSHIVTLNCLYHAFKILLYRPMITGRGQRECEGPSPVQRYLVESVTSATSIIAIFDLFCRTFTMNYCVLSLAYCVYIASSIFLLQVQAAPDDQQAMRKLTYCIQCLRQVRQISPASALNNINKELTAVGITVGPSMQQSPQTQPSSSTGSSAPLPSGTYQTSADIGRQIPIPSHPVYQPSFSHNFGPDAMSMEPGVFEAMSTLEPLSIRVGTIPQSENPPSFG